MFNVGFDQKRLISLYLQDQNEAKNNYFSFILSLLDTNAKIVQSEFVQTEFNNCLETMCLNGF